MSEHHQEGLAHLLYGLNKGGGFVALTGEVGTGKTTLCHCLLEQWPDDIDIALVLNPKLNALELLATICDELHIGYNQRTPTLKDLVDNLNRHLLATHAKGRRTVLMIDEAQNLSRDVLEQIRLLTNLETSQTKLLQIVLVGQPELQKLLSLPELRQLNQRITARYHLLPLSFSETKKYIKHRLRVSGGNPQLFKYRALKQIFKLSSGIPRLINIICDRALLGAYVNDSQIVTAKIVNKAAKEVLNHEQSTGSVLYQTVLFVSIMLAVFIVFYPDMIKHFELLNETTSIRLPEKPSVQNEAVTMDKKVSKAPDFRNFVNQQPRNLNEQIPNLAKLWQVPITTEEGCRALEQAGLQCFYDRAEWMGLLSLKRPLIMELSLSETDKRYVLFMGIKSGKAVFKSQIQASYTPEQVLPLWDGYYLMLWQPPIPAVKALQQGQVSEAVIWVRKHLNPNWDDAHITASSTVFDQALKKQVIEFQQSHHLITDGIVGPRTFIQLENNIQQKNSPELKMED